jgi:hypothetical protein
MSVTVELDKKKKIVTIKMPLESPRPSASGKTKLIASTRGVKSSDMSYLGHPVMVVANAFFYDEQPPARKPKTNAEPVADDELEDE